MAQRVLWGAPIGQTDTPLFIQWCRLPFAEDSYRSGILPPMAPGKRRGIADPLKSLRDPRWLVIRDRCSRAIEYRELWLGTDLRAAMEFERARPAAEGWRVEDIPKNCAFCFADRGEERVCIAIECYEPGTAGLGHG